MKLLLLWLLRHFVIDNWLPAKMRILTGTEEIYGLQLDSDPPEGIATLT
jgi:hypothetical protein